ncbi:MAG: hypothetical protein KDH88_02415 [Chromatiales bacterium]|nr:hypothetical protein [Chromatiales bacterium]
MVYRGVGHGLGGFAVRPQSAGQAPQESNVEGLWSTAISLSARKGCIPTARMAGSISSAKAVPKSMVLQVIRFLAQGHENEAQWRSHCDYSDGKHDPRG